MNKPFIHLHNHSDYSLLDGAAKARNLVDQAVRLGMPALALTDHGNLFGAVEFYKAARQAEIKPIIGMEAYVTLGDMRERKAAEGTSVANHITLLAENRQGFRNLIRITSQAYLEGFYYKPRVDLAFLEQHSEGLIALSGCAKGLVADMIYRDRFDRARELAAELRDLFGPENFFIEIMDHGIEIERKQMPHLIDISRELGIPLVATNDTHYLCREHHEAQDALVCIQTGKEIDDNKRLKFNTEELYLKSAEEMYELFSGHEDALARTVEIAERCNVEMEFGNNYLPAFPLPEGMNEFELLTKMAYEGTEKRYGRLDDSLKERLEKELAIIEKTGFPGYFLIVSDLVRAAREMGVPVGPGRGSAAGSLVSYGLGITNIDPLEYNLLFERFLNPERVNMPDIDIDFADRERDRIIQYVREKYGDESVCQIITFGTMAAHMVVRDVGRVMGMSFDEADEIAKMIPEELKMTLDKALQVRPDLAERAEKDPRVGKLIEMSRVLEGVNRHASTHAAGVVIAPGRLTDYVPLFRSPRKNEITTQWDMGSVESVGLLKIDILGLRTLTVIQDTLEMIERAGGERIVLDSLPLNDPDAFRVFANGETVGIFQFESSGMREYLRKLKPEVIGDIIAMNALYRPGPMDMIDDFIDRKQGKVRVEYQHPILQPILRETYGVMVYQEQVMQIASEMGGFTLGGADMLRRAMGKKKVDVMAEQKEKFLAGAKEKNVDPRIAAEVFDLMAKFAGYGFNKSHAAGYSVLAYQTAWLKAHYPREFMAANLTSVMNNSDRVAVLLEECRRMKIRILPPDVNESMVGFTVVEEGIRFGMAAVKNVGVAAVEEILRARGEGGPFTSLGDFLDRVGLRAANRRMVESLILSGAMSSIPGRPEQLLKILEETMQACQKIAAERSSGQIGLFGEQDDSVPTGEQLFPELPENYDAWDHRTPLEYEKEYLGFYVSGHPLDSFSEELEAFTNASSANFHEKLGDAGKLRMGGMIAQVRTFFDRNNKQCAVFTLEDRLGSVDVFAFSDTFERHNPVLYSGSAVLVSGKLSKRARDDKPKLIADWIMPLDQVRRDEGVGVEVSLDAAQTSESTLEKLQKVLLENSGESPVYLRVHEPNGDYLLRSREVFAEASDSLLASLRELLGDEKKVRLGYHPRLPHAAAAGGGGGATNSELYALYNGGGNGEGNGGANGGGGGRGQ